MFRIKTITRENKLSTLRMPKKKREIKKKKKRKEEKCREEFYQTLTCTNMFIVKFKK